MDPDNAGISSPLSKPKIHGKNIFFGHMTSGMLVSNGGTYLEVLQKSQKGLV